MKGAQLGFQVFNVLLKIVARAFLFFLRESTRNSIAGDGAFVAVIPAL